jgi:hypothetical protein
VLQPRDGCSAPHLGKHLTAEKLDAGEDVVLTHSGPAHAHREVIDAGAMLGNQHIDNARRNGYAALTMDRMPVNLKWMSGDFSLRLLRWPLDRHPP